MCVLQGGNLSTLVINYRTKEVETVLRGTSNASTQLVLCKPNNSLKELTKE